MRVRSLFLLSLLFAFSAAADETANLCELIRLWTAVRYYQPYLYDRDIDWDAAFVAAVPKVRYAQSDAERTEALRAMLAVTGDAITSTRAAYAAPTENAARTADGVLYLDFRQFEGFEGAMRLSDREEEVAKQIEDAKSIVVDMRTGKPDAEFFVLEELPVVRDSSQPAQRQIMHSGYRPQDDGSSRGYYTAFFTVPKKTWTKTTDGKRLVFVIDNVTPVPPFVRALQESGAAQIVSEGRMNLAPPQMAVKLMGGYTAWIRIAEPLEAWDGGADVEVAPGEGFDAAKKRLRGPEPQAHARKPVPLPELNWRRDERYADMKSPAVEYRLLAAARMWGIISEFYPYIDLIGDWDAVLPKAVRWMLEAQTEEAYDAAVIKIMRNVADTHTNILGTPTILRLTGGRSPMPIEVKQVEHRWIVTRILDEQAAYGATVGDELLSIDGEPVAHRAERLSEWLTASSPAGLRYRLALRLTAGDEGSTGVALLEKSDGTRRELRAPRKRSYYTTLGKGEAWRLITPEIGYVDLRVLTVSQIDAMMEAMRNTQAIVFDMRGYPNGVATPMIGRFNKRNAKIGAIFRRRLVQAPIGNETNFSIEFRQELPTSEKWKYAGETFMLVDEQAISQAEHTAIWMKVASGTKFVGTPTAGADGDVTWFYLPGGLRVSFTGHDVRHADGRQLQRVGIEPDLKVAPTVAGIRAGRDEVLEAAIALATQTLRKPAPYHPKS
ncbi:MAG: hypothetical protein JOZ54_22905 [Acidobacteria bacterium]|nr:hypothetical protein [Acidobacteriota bacterium]